MAYLEDVPLFKASSTSTLMILSLGPVPLTELKSTPLSSASFLAKGEINYLSPPDYYLDGVGAACCCYYFAGYYYYYYYGAAY